MTECYSVKLLINTNMLSTYEKDCIRQKMRLEIATEDDITNYYKN